MECYRIHIPDGAKVEGFTAGGRSSTVLPGEYLAHLFRPKLSRAPQEVLRLVGADASGRDVHVAPGAIRRFVECVGASPADAGSVDQERPLPRHDRSSDRGQ
jgi:hypothetical protein